MKWTSLLARCLLALFYQIRVHPTSSARRRTHSSMGKNIKLAYSTESPYTNPEWLVLTAFVTWWSNADHHNRPVLSSNDEADIVDLLCRLLEPVGNHRRDHIKPSKGKSSRKRNRKRSLTQDAAILANSSPAPPTPDILFHITLGLNTTIRHLESLSATSRPQSLGRASIHVSKDETAKSVEPLGPLSAVFVCRTGLPPILTSSLPLLAATASLAFPEEPPIRLVPLGQVAEEKLAQSLHQPKVGFIGLQSDASSAGNIIDLVRNRVHPVDVPWLKEASSGTYLPVKVRQTEVKVGRKKKSVQFLRDNGGQK